MAEMILKPRFWQGNKLKFDSLVSSMQLERGKIYFVGDSISQRANGLDNSAFGIINIATSSTTFVQFGTFDLKDIEKRITEIEQRLEEVGGNIDELIKEVVTLDEELVTLGGKVSEIGSKVSTIEEGAEKNKINAIERNGQAITPSEDKVINILVPVNTSELNNDSKYLTDADVAETIIGVNLNVASGIITLTRKNGTTFTIDLPTEKIIKSGYYDSASEEIVLVLADDSEIRFNASQLIDEYYADNVTLEQYTDTADGNKKKFRIKTSYKNKIDGSEQTSNKTASVSSSSTATQYPSALAVWNAIKDFATKVQTFSQTTTRANIESGETISTIFGKISKWFADLKEVAFSGSYNDLGDKPTISSLASLEPDSTEESFTDTQKIIASRASGVWEKAYSKTALMMWNYIKSKIESVLGLTESNYSGTADKANKDGKGNIISENYTISTSAFSEKISIHQFWQELRTTPSKIGSVLLGTTTGIGSQIKGGWYNFIFMSHYTNSGTYGSILITPMTVSNSRRPEAWILQIENNTSSITNVLRLSNQQGGYYDVLEITDSNLSTYYDVATEILSGIPKEVCTIVFTTTNQYKISAVQVIDVFNGKRIALVGNYIPSEHYANTTISGRFSQYLYEHRYGEHGGGDQNTPAEFYEDFIYFNGIWFGKGY
ncbi:MAG: hypothetical protein UIG52_00420 [Bacteroidales bacterium]|nr:hypothetical protein [Bacteroidales bacterium]